VLHTSFRSRRSSGSLDTPLFLMPSGWAAVTGHRSQRQGRRGDAAAALLRRPSCLAVVLVLLCMVARVAGEFLQSRRAVQRTHMDGDMLRRT